MKTSEILTYLEASPLHKVRITKDGLVTEPRTVPRKRWFGLWTQMDTVQVPIPKQTFGYDDIRRYLRLKHLIFSKPEYFEVVKEVPPRFFMHIIRDNAGKYSHAISPKPWATIQKDNPEMRSWWLIDSKVVWDPEEMETVKNGKQKSVRP